MKIKIFVDAHVFDSTYQGTTTYIKGIYSELVKDPGFEITLAAKNIENLKTQFPNPEFKFLKLPEGSKIKRLLLDIPRLITEHQFHYAHFQYIIPFRKKCRTINTIHDLLFLDFPGYFPLGYRLSRYLSFRYSAMRSDLICTVSEYSKEALLKHFRLNAKKIIITPNAVSTEEREPSDVKKKYGLGKFILFVSRFEPRKNHYLLLEQFVKLKLYEKGYSLVFIGRMKDVLNEKYNRFFSGLSKDIKASVLHVEDINDGELMSFYKAADLFVYPSYAEGFGIPPLEAGIAGCKVLCSGQTAMKDFDFFGKYLFDPNNPSELEYKLAETLEEKNYPYESIRQAIIQRYNWKSISDHFSGILKEDHEASGFNRK